MHTKFSWTASLGRWSGVPLRAHLLFLLFAIVVMGLTLTQGSGNGQGLASGLALVLLVFFSALFHEMAHFLAAVHYGGRVEEIEILPWGGESVMHLPREPKRQAVVFAAGPLFNLAVFLVSGSILALSGNSSLWSHLATLPVPLMEGGALDLSLLKIAAWVNAQMFIVNLLPVYPFDAARVLRCVVVSHNPQVSRLRLESVLMGIGIGVGLVMFVFAWLSSRVPSDSMPHWVLLACFGLILVFSARFGFHNQIVTQRRDSSTDLSDDYSEFESFYEDEEEYLEEYEEELYSDWLSDHKSGSETIERSVELEEDRRVDRILEKLHRQGSDSLTEEERSFLNRISLRYRRRRQLRS